MAIIVPIKNRDACLAAFLNHYHRIFHSQGLCYQIFAVIQTADGYYNRGRLLNIGFVEASKQGFDCFIFHDVDEMLLNPHLKYGCENSPANFITRRIKPNHLTPSSNSFGTVCGFSTTTFERINGYSNCYWSYGGENDDLYKRVVKLGFNISRTPAEFGLYFPNSLSQSHKPNLKIVSLNKMFLNSNYSHSEDGLNKLSYKIVSMEYLKLYTRITVNVMTKNDYCLKIFESKGYINSTYNPVLFKDK
ncbi:Beta-1,4-galactosyltransferase 5 [Thelohanellus kitauei]|uniref:Beta-1,4-galactosyltransferase 5 n=1 Tax=Thelohanellus kitauei TaxID=669202 RepID=A0A0C2MD02_THEKT|nr:Beta-1,4-galactosyltransferase 5 [Thelohanellus kitauei]